MNKESWSLFHDGIISKIEGSLPGDLVLTVNILYIRQMFEGEGRGFTIELKNCTQIEFEEWDKKPTTDLDKIREIEPEILSLETEEPTVINCSQGILKLKYDKADLFLDRSTEVTDELLEQASKKYWDNFQKRNNRTKESTEFVPNR